MQQQGPVNTAQREFDVLARRFVEDQDLQSFQFPPDFLCALTHKLMIDPVMTATGSLYERQAIEGWFAMGNNVNPQDNRILPNLSLTPCEPVRRRIDAWKQAVQALGPLPAQRLDAFLNQLYAVPQQGMPMGNPVMPAPVPFNPVVRFTNLPHLVTTESKALHAALHDKSFDNATNVLGSYLTQKHAHIISEYNSGDIAKEYKHSAREFVIFNHLMHKLEILSHDVIRHGFSRGSWLEALKPFRRQLYYELMDADPIVAVFANGILGGSQHLPELTDMDLFGRSVLFPNYSVSAVQRKQINSIVGIELLQQVHTVFLIDDSGSMESAGHTGWIPSSASSSGSSTAYSQQTRWKQVATLLEGIAPIVTSQDPQGIDIHFLNGKAIYTGVRSTQAVQSIFAENGPNGGTPTGRKMGQILDAYMSSLRYDPMLKPMNLIVLTDGEANDDELLRLTIENHVHHLHHRGYIGHQIGIEFIQVGDDMEATRHLHRIEEEVSKHHSKLNRDVVGVTPTTYITSMNSEIALQIVLSGVDARMNGYLRQRKINV